MMMSSTKMMMSSLLLITARGGEEFPPVPLGGDTDQPSCIAVGDSCGEAVADGDVFADGAYRPRWSSAQEYQCNWHGEAFNSQSEAEAACVAINFDGNSTTTCKGIDYAKWKEERTPFGEPMPDVYNVGRGTKKGYRICTECTRQKHGQFYYKKYWSGRPEDTCSTISQYGRRLGENSCCAGSTCMTDNDNENGGVCMRPYTSDPMRPEGQEFFKATEPVGESSGNVLLVICSVALTSLVLTCAALAYIAWTKRTKAWNNLESEISNQQQNTSTYVMDA